MRCRAARKRLSAYTDGALALYEMVALKEHLSQCAACRSDLQALRHLNRRLSERAAPAPAINWPAFEARLARRLDRQRLNIWALPWYRQATVKRAVAAAAAVVLILVGVGVWLNAWLRPTLVNPPPTGLAADSTLVFERKGQVETVTWVAARAEPAPTHATPNEAPPDSVSLRLAWLAGKGPVWDGDTTHVTVRYDGTHGEPTEHHYVFQPAPR